MDCSIVMALVIGCAVPSGIWASGHDRCCAPGCGHCMVPPPPFCPKCTCPCYECRLRLCPACKVKDTYALIEHLLLCPNSQARKNAAEKLGCRWHADFCQTPEVLSALIAALHDDACWEVRRAAATSLRQQNARTPPALLALYIASKLDPHYLVRERANESIDILLVLQRPCYKELFKEADKLVGKLRGKYKPGSQDMQNLYALSEQVLRGGLQEETAKAETPPAPSGEMGEDLPGPTN